MNARPTASLAVAAALLAACAQPYYALFPPLPADVHGERVACARFSLLIPTEFRVAEDHAESLIATESAPANGQNRVHRRIRAVPVPAIPADDEEALATAGLATLEARYAGDALEVSATGRSERLGRMCPWLRGTIAPSSYDLRLDLFAVLVPGEPQSLLVEFVTPAGQMSAADPGYASVLASLQTDLAAPGFGGELLWFDGDRFGVRLGDDWQRQADAEGGLAVFTSTDGEARCDVTTATRSGGYDLDRLAHGWAGDQAAQWPDLRLASIERGTRAGRSFARFRGAFHDDQGTVFVDDIYIVRGDCLDRVLFRVPHANQERLRAGLERAVRSLRWRD